MGQKLRTATAAAICAACILGAGASYAQDNAIRLIVGFSPGGGFDMYARLLARHYGRHLPGNPNVIVQNMPGSSSLKAVQYLDQGAPKDGNYMTAFNPGLMTNSLLEPDKVTYNFSNLGWVGSITQDYRVCYAWNREGNARNWDELTKQARFNMGTTSIGSSAYQNAAALKNIFGVKIHHVLGYPGSAEERIAIERGELDGGCGAWASNPQDWIVNKRITPIVTFTKPSNADPSVKAPYILDLAKTSEHRAILEILTAADLLGRPYVVSKAVPAARLDVLRKGFDAAMADKEFLAEAGQRQLPIAPVSGPEAQQVVERLYKASPELVAKARDAVK
ncbi:MAG: Bug family tripartite tricarboxylate transporter substrate binding protein [Beijerinckiaceae bacterium]